MFCLCPEGQCLSSITQAKRDSLIYQSLTLWHIKSVLNLQKHVFHSHFIYEHASISTQSNSALYSFHKKPHAALNTQKLYFSCILFIWGATDIESGFFSYYILSMRCKSMQHRGQAGEILGSLLQTQTWIFWRCITVRSKCLMPLFSISHLAVDVASPPTSHTSRALRQKAIPCAHWIKLISLAKSNHSAIQIVHMGLSEMKVCIHSSWRVNF